MEKLTRQELDGICQLLHHTYNKEMTQYILNTIGKDNWTRDIFSECHWEYLTKEQEDLCESLGGCGYTDEEMDEFIESLSINEEIVERLKAQGVSKYLYENEEYLDEIRRGTIICEGIDIEEIKKNYMGINKSCSDIDMPICPSV
ncbi:MAG: hypothetical protein ACI35T_04070 [Alistipes sp.]